MPAGPGERGTIGGERDTAARSGSSSGTSSRSSADTGGVDPRSPSAGPIGSPGRISPGMNPRDANVDIGGFGGFARDVFNTLSPIDISVQRNPLSQELDFGARIDPVAIGIAVATAINPALGLMARGVAGLSGKGTVEAPKEDVTSAGDKQKQQKQLPPAEQPLENVVSPVLSSAPSAEFAQDSIFDQVLDNTLKGRPLFTPLS